MINNNRSIENAWNMLQYLYVELMGKRFRSIDITNIETLDDLYGLVISRWCASIAKEGLYKEYVEVVDDELTSPKGQINVQATIATQSLKRGSLICSYDELSENIYINHVLKGTLQYIMYCENVSKLVKTEVTKALQLYNGVDYVDIKYIHWKSVKFNNNNARYIHLIEVCKTFITERKAVQSLDLDDDKRLYLLFKKQIQKWCKHKYGEDDKVELMEVPYTMLDTEPAFEVRVNKNQTLVAISTDKEALIMCIRLQDELMIEDATLGRRRTAELVKYLRDYKREYKVKTFGCMVYVNINPKKLNLQPITMNSINDYMVGETIVDIHDQWKFIENKLEDAYKYFIQREKNKNAPMSKRKQ